MIKINFQVHGMGGKILKERINAAHERKGKTLQKNIRYC